MMNWTFVLGMLLCVVLAGCGNAPERVDMIAEGDSRFMLHCAPSDCRKRATDTCQAQGYSRYDVVEQVKGDEQGEGGGLTIQCKK